EIFEISHDGEKCIADSISRFDTEDFAIMNASAGSFDPVAQKTLLAVGRNEFSQIYELHLSSERHNTNNGEQSPDKDNNGGGTLRKRRSNGEIPHGKTEELLTPLTFKVIPGQSFQTDFG
ncbi:Prolactin regulatory elementbinding proteinlike, partial [Caligus rogercresseyi]